MLESVYRSIYKWRKILKKPSNMANITRSLGKYIKNIETYPLYMLHNRVKANKVGRN